MEETKEEVAVVTVDTKDELVKELLSKLSVKDLQKLLLSGAKPKPKKKAAKKKTAVKKKAVAVAVEEAPKKRGRPRKVVEVAEEAIDTREIEEYNDEGVDSSKYIRRPTKKRNQPRINSGQSKLKCREADFEVGIKRPNLFLQSSDAKSCKDDAKLDKVLLKGVKPTRRRQESNMVEIQCRKCRQYVEVYPSAIMCSADRFVCNDCTRG
jgi:hypothetical protein